MSRRRPIQNKGPAPNWVLQHLEDYPDSLESLWEIHRTSVAQWLPKLIPEFLSELASSLKPACLPGGIEVLLASDLACQYIRHLDYLTNAPRDGRVADELEAIRIAALQLQRALCAASGYTLRGLRGEFTTTVFNQRGGIPEMDLNREQSKEWQRLLRSSLLFFSADRTTTFDLAKPNPEFIGSLDDLLKAAELRKGKTPSDRGGPKSGLHDSTGSNARSALALEIRRILRYLGLPHGAQKGGPVSRTIELVHQAVTGEVPSWADRYAAMTPKLEKEWEAIESRG